MSAVPESAFAWFRAMTQADVEAVMEIETRAYEFPWTAQIFRDCMRVGYRCRVLEQQGGIEAYAIMSLGAGEAHVLNLCVRPESEGCGLARRMLDHLLEQARSSGVQTMFLEVRPSNARALKLYQLAGFCEIGIRRDYYPLAVGREDALVMGKEL